MPTWPTNPLTKRLKISYPIIQAPMAGSATPELVAAVSNSGGLGSLAAGYMNPSDIRKAIAKIRTLTTKPFAVNLFVPNEHHATAEDIATMCQIIEKCCHELAIKIDSVHLPYIPSFAEQLAVIMEEKVPIFSFTFGIPQAEYITQLKNKNILLIGTATNIEEAIQLEKNGIDFVVAQSGEAGGHRGTFIGSIENSLTELHQLLLQLVDALKIPVIAAGGIMNGEDIVKSLKLGAQAVQMGTAFLSCPESGAPNCYKEKLLNTKTDETVLTRAFSGRTARGLNNKFITCMKPYEKNILDYPIQNALTQNMRKLSAKQNNPNFISLWAGQRAYLSRGLSANELMKALITEVESLNAKK